MLGWRGTAAAMLPIWFALPFLARQVLETSEGFQDLAFVILMFIAYCVGVLAVIPAFAFTIGRWLDRRSAPRGVRSSATTFGLYGFGFGIFLMLLLGFNGLTPMGIAVVVLAPTLTAVAGRLLLELRGLVWEIVLWAAFGIAVAVAFALIITTLGARSA